MISATDPKETFDLLVSDTWFQGSSRASRLGGSMHGSSLLEQVKQRPVAVWVLLLYLALRFIGLIDSAISWQQQVYGSAPINWPIGLVISAANAVLFMALLVGSSIYALWYKSKLGLIVSCLIACLFLYQSVLIDVLGGSVEVYVDETGAESTAFFHVYGHRLHQLLLITLASIPIWSRSTRRYVGWGTSE